MKIQADENGTLKCAELVPAFTVFDVQKLPDGSVQFTSPPPERRETKLVRDAKGRLMIPGKISNEDIARAIRFDRDGE